MRATATEVKQIIDTDLEDPVVEAYITSANTLVGEVFDDSSSVSEDSKKEIEKWLAAHFIACTREQQMQSAKAQTAEVEYQGKTYTGLYATFYGQQAVMLDPSGKLATLGKKAASIYAVGGVPRGKSAHPFY
jgi:hypothetical protein